MTYEKASGILVLKQRTSIISRVRKFKACQKKSEN
jgi:hypothetical protein